ncbi:MAG: hypothetical protein OCD01_05205 [Fibrobacterales bacterium]
MFVLQTVPYIYRDNIYSNCGDSLKPSAYLHSFTLENGQRTVNIFFYDLFTEHGPEATMYVVQVVDKSTSSIRSKSHYLDLEAWGPRKEVESVSGVFPVVSSIRYQNILNDSRSDTYSVCSHK